MTAGQQWLRRPQTLGLRKAIFQVHLWTGVGLGLYVLMISVSGSVLVFRNELYTVLWPGPKTVTVSGPRLTRDELKAAARRIYPGYSVNWIWESKQPNQATEIWLDRGSSRKERLFDPYTGEDLGESRPYSIQFLRWVGDLHVDLLAGERGRKINGACALLVVLLSLTGGVLWWPGVQNWRRSLTIQRKTNWKQFNWQLHSAVGLWMLAVVWMFGVVGVYAGFPAPFQAAVNRIAPLDFYRLDPESMLQPSRVAFLPVAQSGTVRPRFRPRLSAGDQIIRWFSYLHFGNFGGWVSKAVWVVLGLAPAFLFVTGVLMWWNRVLSPGARRLRRTAS
ncbi:MAG TPA: PepSY-associated TM helix domain-containing protein [Bryobacteraceae bacterium]|nr:PepSY-associated TM helix domain-containing protein [Bryobacteraceae bacterium]